MTQTDEIRKIIRQIERGTLFDTAEIRERTNFPNSSIRRVLGNLARNEEISRVERGLYRTGRDETRRKFVSGLFYCGGKKRQFFAETFEKNTIDREEELISAIESAFGNCSDMRLNHGYTDDIFTEGQVPDSVIYPTIEVGEL